MKSPSVLKILFQRGSYDMTTFVAIKNELKVAIPIKLETPVELVSDKLIMSLDGLHTSNSPKKIDHTKCTILANDTVVFDVIFHNYFQESLLEDVICGNCSSGSSESIKSTFTVSKYLKEPPSVIKILFQRGTYDMTTGEVIKNELKVTIPLEFLYKNYKLMIRYHKT